MNFEKSLPAIVHEIAEDISFYAVIGWNKGWSFLQLGVDYQTAGLFIPLKNLVDRYNKKIIMQTFFMKYYLHETSDKLLNCYCDPTWA